MLTESIRGADAPRDLNESEEDFYRHKHHHFRSLYADCADFVDPGSQQLNQVSEAAPTTGGSTSPPKQSGLASRWYEEDQMEDDKVPKSNPEATNNTNLRILHNRLHSV